MRLRYLLLVALIFFGINSETNAQTYNEELYSGLEYRLVGPFRGGRSAAVTGVPNKPNLVRGNVSSGYGMWKSVDAGKTWKSSGLKNSRHIPRIAVDPNNHNIVYAGVMGNLYKPTQERGVYKSTDGGKT